MEYLTLAVYQLYLYLHTTPAPPTPTEVTAEVINTSSVRVAWQWTSSGPAPNCFNTTTVTYRPEGGGESSLQLSDPAATEATLTDLQCNTNYTITVVATAGEHRREGVAFLPLTLQIQGILNSWRPVFVVITHVYHHRPAEPLSICAFFYINTFDMGGSLSHTAVPYLLQGDMWILC